MKALILHAYSVEKKVLEHLQSPLLLVIRLYWGWQFFLTGKGKLGNLDRVTEFFTSLSIPAPRLNAIMAGTTEMLGGLCLFLGLGGRIATIPLIFTMLVAYVTADREAVTTLFSKPDNFLKADPFLFLLASVIVLVFGPGWISADHFIAKHWKLGKAEKAEEKK
ncbi:MAG TPA: DoxX family protein [Planctomycetota bacterium]|nr:DoxX family protein [Planctomycetota bacterium]